MNLDKEPIVISVDTVEAVRQSPRLFPEVVAKLGGTSLEDMRAVRDTLHDLIREPQTPPEMVE